jgi:hypothetical protein
MVGDVLLCSGMIAYMGIFELNYRKYCIENWKKKLIEKNIHTNIDFTLKVFF